MRRPGSRPAERPSDYVIAFVVLMGTAIAFPNGFELVTLGAGVLVVLVWVVLLLRYPNRSDGEPASDGIHSRREADPQPPDLHDRE